MNIIHLDLPRYFTLSVRDYLTDAASLLAADGHTFTQYDINPNFWRWLLALSTPHSPGDCFEAITAVGGSERLWPALAELKAHFADLTKLYGVPVSLGGIRLPRAVINSSYAMCSLVADNYGCGLFSTFFQQLDARFNLRGADLISLGLDSQEGVFWALQLASWLRSAGSNAHICIARHAWENFSLLPHVDALAKNPWFFGVIQSIILYQEELPQTLRALANALEPNKNGCHGPAQFAGPCLAEEALHGLHNIAIKTADAVVIRLPQPADLTALRVTKAGYHIPDHYFQSMDVPPDQIVYAMAMVRNKCFYKKCTFCVQIAKHISDNAYVESAEVQRSLDAAAELGRHGVSMINFMDEAMRPVDIRDFCRGLGERGLRIHWVGRMIAAANPNVEILRLMQQAGCVEILFGLETFNPALSADMGKVSRFHEDDAVTAAMIETFLDAGLFLILSMIYDFPTEQPAALEQTLANMRRLLAKYNRIAVIFNRFNLLHVSRIYESPASFNIASVEPRLPENDLQYSFHYERQTPIPSATPEQLALMHRLSLGLCEERYATLLARHGKELLDMAYTLDYVSLGFRHRAQTNRTLAADLFHNYSDVARVV